MKDFIELVQGYGPSVAGWVFLLVFFAWISGVGGRAVMRNFKTLLDTGEELRERMILSLDDYEKQIRDRDEKIKTLNADIETAHKTLRQMSKEMLQMEQTMRMEMNVLERKIQELTFQLEVARLKNEGTL